MQHARRAGMHHATCVCGLRLSRAHSEHAMLHAGGLARGAMQCVGGLAHESALACSGQASSTCTCRLMRQTDMLDGGHAERMHMLCAHAACAWAHGFPRHSPATRYVCHAACWRAGELLCACE